MTHLKPIRRHGAVAGLLALGSCLSVHVSGCSLIGLAGGAIIDARRPATALIPTGKLHAFRAGDSLALFMRDSTRVAGRYAGVQRMSEERYRERYGRRSDARTATLLPRPGASVRVALEHPVLTSGGESEFLAFLIDAIEIRDRRGRVKTLPIREVREVLWNEGRARLTRRDMEQLRLDGALPMAVTMTIDTRSGPVTVPLDDVAWVWGPGMKHAARKGFILGLIADGIVVAAAVVAVAGSSGPSGGASCEAPPGTLYSRRMHERMQRAAAAPSEWTPS